MSPYRLRQKLARHRKLSAELAQLELEIGELGAEWWERKGMFGKPRIETLMRELAA